MTHDAGELDPSLMDRTAGQASDQVPQPDEGTPAGTVTRRSNAQLVWDAVVDLSNDERHITRKVLCDVTGLKAQIVDDHVERMILHGKLRRLGYGVLEVVEQFPAPRVISKTVLPNGLVKLDVGDTCLDLTPKEARTLAGMFCVELNSLTDIDASSHYLARAAELAGQMREMQRQLTKMVCGSPH